MPKVNEEVPERTEELLRDSIALHEKLVSLNPRSRARRRNLAAACQELGEFLTSAQRFVEAENMLRRALALYEELMRRCRITSYQPYKYPSTNPSIHPPPNL
ncbi:MAG: tetratricopeptide repeat protein [Thermoplasmata archaeon]